jgi:cobalt/nickel transport system permease protein
MKNGRFGRTFWMFGGLTLLLAGGLSLFASGAPDGLERVAIDSGFIEKETAHWQLAIMPDYSVSWMGDGGLGTAIAGLLGAAAMFSVLWLLGRWWLARKQRE